MGRLAPRLLVATLLLAALTLTACQSAGSCIERVPEALRADLVRYVVVKDLVREHDVPRLDRDLGREQGRDPATLTVEETRTLARYASVYAHCVNRLLRR